MSQTLSNIKLSSRKNKTYSEFQHALAIGCDYFSRPIFSVKPVSELNQCISTVANSSVVNFKMAESVISEPTLKDISHFEGDVELSFKLLR